MAPEIADIVALSPTQRAMYLVSASSPDVDPYNVQFSVRLSGLTDVGPVRAAIEQLLRRYPHLAASVVSAGLPHPVLVVPAAPHAHWEERDLRGAPAVQLAADEVYRAEGRRKLDLTGGPLTRVVAARLAEREHELMFTIHHVVVDGFSVPLLYGDLVALLTGAADALPAALPIREHAAWLARRPVDAAIEAWRAALDGLADSPTLAPPAPADLPEVGEARLSRADGDAVSAWARRHGLTLNTVFQLAWARVLSGLTSRDDVVFGQTTTGRDPSLPGAERMVGGLIATVPVRVRVSAGPPAEVGVAVQREGSQLRAHDHLGVNQIASAVGVATLFDSLLVFENIPVVGADAWVELPGGGRLGTGRIDSFTHFPVVVVPIVIDGEIITRVEIRPDLVPRFRPEVLARRFLAVVRRIIEAPTLSSVAVLLDGEAATTGPAAAPDESMHRTVPQALAEALDARPPASIAVIDRWGAQTVPDFGAAVRTLTEELLLHGVRPDDRVGVMLRRDRRVLQAPFGVAGTGALCVHLDPDTPAGRLASILDGSGVGVVLAEPSHRPLVDAVAEELGRPIRLLTPDGAGHLSPAPAPAAPEAPVPPRFHPGRPLYAIFTSGTTNRPKGVVTSHRGLLAFWAHHARRVYAPLVATLGRTLRVGHNWSTGFDAAWQPTVALLSGHTLVIVPDEARNDPKRLVSFITENDVDFMETSPSMFLRLAEAGLLSGSPGEEACFLRILGLGGEAIQDDTWQRLRRLDATRVLNFYGPTETTVDAFMADVADHEHTSIGAPTLTMTAEVLDHRLRPVPTGGVGELYLSGPQLAMGYLGQPGLTAAAFVAGPDGRRRYRTGDLVCLMADGGVAYLGRVDNQIKINGYRVEPSEVSATLRQLPGVRNAEVLVDVHKGRTRLAALVVSDHAAAAIREALTDRLPHFMVPALIVNVDQIPLNRNDKLDLAAAARIIDTARPAAGGAEPITSTEAALSEVAGLPPDTALADAGLDSLAVMDLVTSLRRRGYQVDAADVFGAADLRELGHLLDGRPGPRPDQPG
ncbi:AMP-binding protein [Dactylosporangium sp. NPDC005572]|uniref:AMP-binding protein n=1 Tax=Dactylosporangium sp. NPDC005572 TaxID=3156889 RepID=UPI0033B19BA8